MDKNPDHLLILYPGNSAWAPENLADLAEALKAIGFLGIEGEPHLYHAGPEYLKLITYLGCSPHIALGENELATTIRLNGIQPAPRFLQGSNLKTPRCPQCRRTLDKSLAFGNLEENLACPSCLWRGQLHKLDWRRSAGFGRVFIEISNVFEFEAVPGENLTDCLQQTSGEVWDYCYVRGAKESG